MSDFDFQAQFNLAKQHGLSDQEAYEEAAGFEQVAKTDNSSSDGQADKKSIVDLVAVAKRNVRAQRQARDELAREQFGIVENTWAPRTLADTVDGLVSGKLKQPQPSLLGRSDGRFLFYRGRINGLFGGYGSGKSWVALVTAREELSRGKAVVFVDFEDDEIGIVGRLLDLGVAPESIRERFFYVHPDAAPTDEEYRGLLELIEISGATLIVVDSVGEWCGLAGVDTNKDDQIAAWAQRYIKRMVRRGAGVVLLDHVPHEERSGSPVLRTIGSQRKMAAITGSSFRVVEVEPYGRGHRGIGKLITSKDRHGHWVRGEKAADLVLDATCDSLLAELRPPRAGADPAMDELLVAVYAAGDDGITASQAADRLLEVKGDTVVDHAARLAAERTARNRLGRLDGLVTHVTGRRGGVGGGARPDHWVITEHGQHVIEAGEKIDEEA
jgi:AAA domain